MQRLPVVITLLVLFFSNKLFSQEFPSPFFQDGNSDSRLINFFEKQLHTSKFGALLDYKKSFDNLNIRVSENFNSTIIKSSLKNIKDDHLFNFSANYKISKFLSPGIFLQNNVYSDDRNLSINNSLRNKVLLTLKSEPLDYLKLFTYGGYSQNKQLNENNKGYYFGSFFKLDNYQYDEFIINAGVKIERDKISPRDNYENNFDVEIFNKFSNDINNLIKINLYTNNKDLYFEADSATQNIFGINSNIKSREEKVYKLSNKLIYFSLMKNLSLTLNGSAGKREILRTTKYNLQKGTVNDNDERIEETNLEFRGNLSYKNDKLRSRFNIAYEEEEEKHIPMNLSGRNIYTDDFRKSREKEKNNKAKILSSDLSANYKLNKKNSISADFYYRKLVYDTPSESNFDDRDELLAILKLGYNHIFNRFFKGFINIEGSSNHVVYIFGEKSSNNNFQRNIKLTAGGKFQNKQIKNYTKAEVLANYTIYDFDDLTPETRSFSFRQLSISDSATYIINDLVRINFSGSVKFSEQGQLDWENFKGKPIRYLTEINFEPNIGIFKRYYEINFGFRYFNLKTYNYRNDSKELNDEYTSSGPIFKLKIKSNKLDFGLYAFLESISTLSSESVLANFDINVSWKF